MEAEVVNDHDGDHAHSALVCKCYFTMNIERRLERKKIQRVAHEQSWR